MNFVVDIRSRSEDEKVERGEQTITGEGGEEMVEKGEETIDVDEVRREDERGKKRGEAGR